jgi:hypothetical protein
MKSLLITIALFFVVSFSFAQTSFNINGVNVDAWKFDASDLSTDAEMDLYLSRINGKSLQLTENRSAVIYKGMMYEMYIKANGRTFICLKATHKIIYLNEPKKKAVRII